MAKYAYGVDIGGTTVKIGLFDAEGTLQEKWEIPTRTEGHGTKILPDVAEALLGKLREIGATVDDLTGIGIGAPGAVLGGSTVNRCANLGWGVVNVAEEMRALTGVPNIKVGNDANVAALGEMWKGGGKGHQSMVMVTLGTGVGGGIILDGKILEGAFGAGGEIGHICMLPGEQATCGCGKRGHLEQYASATGIVRLAREAGMSAAQTERKTAQAGMGAAPVDVSASQAAGTAPNDNLTAKDVIDAAKAGDPVALGVMEQVTDILGRALAGISCVVDTEIYVIGGGVSNAGTFLLDMIREHYRAYAFHASEQIDFALAEMGNDAGMYGAVKLVL